MLIYTQNFRLTIKDNCLQDEAVVDGPAGLASAGPLFWPSMLSTMALFLVSGFSFIESDRKGTLLTKETTISYSVSPSPPKGHGKVSRKRAL